MGRALTRLGFYLKSQRGSHIKYVRERDIGKDIVIVPNHRVIRKGTLNTILKKIDVDVATLKELL